MSLNIYKKGHNLEFRDIVLYVLVLAIVFENWDPMSFGGTLSIAKIVTVFYFISLFPSWQKQFSFKRLADYLVPLYLYIIVEVISSFLNMEYADSFADITSIRVLQFTVLMLAISNHLLLRPHIVPIVIRIYILSIFLLSILYMFGIGIDVEYVEQYARLSLFGENPNGIGIKGAVALMLIFSMALQGELRRWELFLAPVASLLILSLVSGTASRGAFLLIFFGGGAMIALVRYSFTRKAILMTLAGLGGIYLFQYFMSNEVLAERFTLMTEEGQTGRNDLWIAGWNLFLDNPILGVGRAGFKNGMIRYFGEGMDTHNAFLYVLDTTGIVGFTFFMGFIGRLWGKSIRLYRQQQVIVFLVITLIISFHMFKGGGILTQTYPWFIFSLIIGGTGQTAGMKVV